MATELKRSFFVFPQCKAYFKKVWLDAVSGKEIPVFRFAAKDDFTHQKDYKRSRQINAWFDEVLPILQDCKHLVVFGQDFARSGDLTVYWLMLINGIKPVFSY
ncbi:MAG: hypothetical protein ACRC4W_00835 [Treponemataceae bacterium]